MLRERQRQAARASSVGGRWAGEGRRRGRGGAEQAGRQSRVEEWEWEWEWTWGGGRDAQVHEAIRGMEIAGEWAGLFVCRAGRAEKRGRASRVERPKKENGRRARNMQKRA